MVKQLVCLLAGMLLLAGNTAAQSGARISSDELRYDFGSIAEENGPASHVFTVRNTGDAPLVITRVTASCGCTMPEWTKAPIEPGTSGEVKITYDPAGRPGPFVKTVSIYSNGKKGAYMLAIKGNVTPKRLKPVILYPYAIGPMKMDTKKILYSGIRPGEALGKKILITNESETPFSVHLRKYPEYLTIQANPSTLKPGEAGEITILFNAKEEKKLGRLTAEIPVTVTPEGQKKGAEGSFRISANVIDDFSKMTSSERADAPVISLSSDWINFGKMKESALAQGFKDKVMSTLSPRKVSQTLEITNQGKSTLHIRSITCDDQRVEISGGKREIKPDATATFKVTLRPKEFKSKMEEVINIISNDPANPVRLIKITAKP